jgi:CheY-like chemotaxis protein
MSMNDEYLPWIVLAALVVGLAAWLLRRKSHQTDQEAIEPEPGIDEAEAVARQAALALEEERRAEAELAELQAQREAAEAEAAAVRLESEREAAAAALAVREEEERRAAEAARAQAVLEEQRRVEQELAEQRARQEAAVAAAREAAIQVAQAEAQRQAAETARALAAVVEAQRRAAAEAARLEAEHLALQRLEAERQAAARLEAERLAEAERERQAAEEAARLEARRQAEVQAAQKPPAARSPAETLVLVADDSKVVRVKTSRLLVKHGYRVSLAEDGDDAVRQMATDAPHVLITDVEMPGLDGFELTRHVRNDPRMAHIPIIMVTAADDKHGPKAAEVGVSILLGKPYEEAELIARVESTLRATAHGTAAALAIQ